VNYFAHPQALCESKTVGDRTRIWAFAHVLPGARIGDDCNICDHVFIENDVVVGDRVTVKCGVQLWDGLRLEDDVFVAPGVITTNDPTAGRRPEGQELRGVTLRRACRVPFVAKERDALHPRHAAQRSDARAIDPQHALQLCDRETTQGLLMTRALDDHFVNSACARVPMPDERVLREVGARTERGKLVRYDPDRPAG